MAAVISAFIVLVGDGLSIRLMNDRALVVCVVDPDTDSVQVHYPDKPKRTFERDEGLVLPEVLPDFRVTVSELFE